MTKREFWKSADFWSSWLKGSEWKRIEDILYYTRRAFDCHDEETQKDDKDKIEVLESSLFRKMWRRKRIEWKKAEKKRNKWGEPVKVKKYDPKKDPNYTGKYSEDRINPNGYMPEVRLNATVDVNNWVYPV